MPNTREEICKALNAAKKKKAAGDLDSKIPLNSSKF
jgi:hypothetical protein